MQPNTGNPKTKQELLDLMKSKVGTPMSAEEILEQKVSYIFGMVGRSSTVTKEQIRQQILESEGRYEE